MTPKVRVVHAYYCECCSTKYDTEAIASRCFDMHVFKATKALPAFTKGDAVSTRVGYDGWQGVIIRFDGDLPWERRALIERADGERRWAFLLNQDGMQWARHEYAPRVYAVEAES
jgi:hypothetical protein